MEESEHIKKLEELIPLLSDITISNSPDVEYDVKNGTSLGFNLYNNEEIAVQRAFASKDSVFPEHVHKKETEILIVYKGEGICYYGDEEKHMNVGDCIKIEPNINHSWKMLKDTWLIGITIPAVKGYPNAR